MLSRAGLRALALRQVPACSTAHAATTLSTCGPQADKLEAVVTSQAGGRHSPLWVGLAAAAGCVALGSCLSHLEGHVVVLPEPAHPVSRHIQDSIGWVQALAAEPDVQQVLTSDTLQSHKDLKQDHLFCALLRHEVVSDLCCFYSEEKRKFSCVMQLGEDVCGYPRIVHGGLTAAILDETFGFLFYAMKHHNQLPFWQPAYTAHLEVDYKAKLQAGQIVLCEAEVESVDGRKLWMKATVRARPGGKVYATSRALFVVPRTSRLIKDGLRYAFSGWLPGRMSPE